MKTRTMNARTLALLIIVGLLCAADGDASAAVRMVPEDYPTIQDGIENAVSGDTVSVASGVYTGDGNRDVNFLGKDLVVRSRQGPADTIIDCEGLGRAFYLDGGEFGAVIEGFSIVRGFSSESGGAIGAYYAGPSLLNCTFALNRADTGGALTFVAAGEIRDCLFLGNEALGTGGGGAIESFWGEPVYENCVFANNVAHLGPGGAIMCHGSDMGFVGCTFTRNASGDRGGALAHFDGTLSIDRSICYGNCASGDGTEIYSRTSGTITCSDIALAGVSGEHLVFGEGMIDLDPLFCDPAACWVPTDEGDYRLDSESPCLPGSNPCGVLIGALGVGCAGGEDVGACCLSDGECLELTQDMCDDLGGAYLGDGTDCSGDPCTPVPVVITSWGKIKSWFRGP